MKTLMKLYGLLCILISFGYSTAVMSQAAVVESLGERSSVYSCFYECKQGARKDTWKEVTTLMLVNQSHTFDLDAQVVFYDGNGHIIANGFTPLPIKDLDEVSVCHTLWRAAIQPPSAGLIEVLISDRDHSASGSYGWVKNPIGKFFKNQPEVFHGRVNGIGKTPCRITPSSVTTRLEVIRRIQDQTPPVPLIDLILIEGTEDNL